MIEFLLLIPITVLLLNIEENFDRLRLLPKRLWDIKTMPDFSSAVTNGTNSISRGRVYWTNKNKVTCRKHGAMLCVSESRQMWRCPACNEGAYMPFPKLRSWYII